MMNRLMMPITVLSACLIPLSTVAQNASMAAQNAQKKEIQRAEKYAEQLSSQTVETPQYAMVGYLESWGTIGIEQAIANNYSMLVIAFGTINGDHVGMNLNCGASMPDGCFLPSVSWWPEPPEWMPNFRNSVLFAHSKGVKVLLSFGGANNTFKPGKTSSTALAQGIVNYLKSLHLDGIDFDLEHMSATDFPGNDLERQKYLSELITQIRHLDNKLIITSAPQINPVQAPAGAEIQLVNTGTETVYNDAIQNNLFDYIFAQAYNTPGFTVDNNCNVLWQSMDDETYPAFIGKIAPCLQKLLPNGSKTKIMIGEPANSSESAGRGALEHGTYSAIANEYNSIKALPSFDGAMTWSINEDSKASDDKGPRVPYSFSNALAPILAK